MAQRAHRIFLLGRHGFGVILADAGVSKADALYAYIWLPDIGDFDAMNAVWDKWLAPGSAPARATVEAKLADPALKVEIQVFAHKAS